MEGDVFHDCVERLSTELDTTLRTLVSGWILEEVFVYTAFAIGTHAFVDGVRISIDSFAQPTGEVLQHVCLGWLLLAAGLILDHWEIAFF